MAMERAHQPTERPYHHGNLRGALLDAAERTVRERGVQALSLRELAREIGVSHGAPRRHFPDRQALLDALAESGFERLAPNCAPPPTAPGMNSSRGWKRPPRPTSGSPPPIRPCLT